ncbi:14884_t:CDS:2 [Entrophospora sp. SA101]|nr:14884_t:CDS:2 [Entrophospora sp. SA101]
MKLESHAIPICTVGIKTLHEPNKLTGSQEALVETFFSLRYLE